MEQIFGRVAANAQFREHNEIDAIFLCVADGAADLLRITAQITNGCIHLSQAKP
jgi:hypothetical protein